MNINKNFRNERKNLRNIKGCTYKITNVSPAMCYSVSNLFLTMPWVCLQFVVFLDITHLLFLMPDQCTDIVLLF